MGFEGGEEGEGVGFGGGCEGHSFLRYEKRLGGGRRCRYSSFVR